MTVLTGRAEGELHVIRNRIPVVQLVASEAVRWHIDQRLTARHMTQQTVRRDVCANERESCVVVIEA